MSSWPLSADGLRAMYQGGRANKAARRFARLWAAVFGWGLSSKRWVTLEVPGRKSGRVTRFPLGMARVDGRWYLVSMLGEDCHWVKNVRANAGNATIRHGRSMACQLIEVPPEDRAPIIKSYLTQVPGARPQIPVDRQSAVADFESITARYPVFRVAKLSPARPGI